MNKKLAAEVKELFGKDYTEFCEVDPFNPKNEMAGVISRKSNEYYGSLIITRVNNREITPQLIMGTPKMHYPFGESADGTRNYAFPSAKYIEIYEKLDGTNVLSYFYTDGENRYLTYKTRLRPFLGSSRFGDFYNMWKETAAPYIDRLRQIMIKHNCNLSFELYGARNPHLVVYKNPLDIALLFGVTNTGKIMSPTKLGLAAEEDYSSLDEIPLVKRFRVINRDYVWNYETTQKELEANLKQEEEGYYSGLEGTVWYLHLIDGRCLQIKCKPETIETIHFSAGAGGLNKNIVIATCWNAFENVDTLTIDFVKQLLIEEFQPEIVEANHYLIERCVGFVTREAEFRNRVLDEYRALGMSILLNKREVMRSLSAKFPKQQMKKVYSIIMSFA
ncbi:MAG: hypothetical protein QME81_02845 [bacterium]|nr:hypothetical protein [bacterium]